MAIDIGTAKIAALFAESLLFGVHSVLFFQAMGILLFKVKRHASGISRPKAILLATCTSLFLLAALHLCISLREMIVAFIGRSDAPGGVAVYFFNFHTAVNVVQNLAVVTSSIIADSVLAYRLYLAWSNNRLIIMLPILLIVSGGVTGYATCFMSLPSKSDIGIPALTPWIKAAYSTSLCTNVFSTVLIAGRIWWASRQLRVRGNLHVSGTSHWEFVETIIQSGMLSAADLACLLGAFVAGSNAWYICFDMLPPLIGVNFTLIIVRLGLGRGTAAETLSSIVVARGRGGDTMERGAVPVGLDVGDKALGLSEITQSGSSMGQGSSKNLPIVGDV